jgi:hypothetical protein
MMTLKELRSFVNKLESVKSKAPDDFNVLAQCISELTGDELADEQLGRIMDDMNTQQEAILAKLSPEDAERLRLLSRATRAMVSLIETGEQWVKIKDKQHGHDW